MTAAHTPPPTGAWLRPVGNFSYCLRAIESWPDDGDGPCTKFERWGLDRDRQAPVQDGHHDHSWIYHLRQVLPGVWRDTFDYGPGNPRWRCCPIYYKLMPSGPLGQLNLI